MDTTRSNTTGSGATNATAAQAQAADATSTARSTAKSGARMSAKAHETPETTGQWSEAAIRVLRERYLKRDAEGTVIETPDELCWRVARAVAQAERQWTADDAAVEAIAERFYRVMAEHRFLPNSPTLMNAGKGNNLQLSACYVVPVEDSLAGIFDAVKHAALIHQSGGGTGFSFSRLRPKGSIVGSTHGVASGPVSFMKIFDGATEAVKQGGTRRGANMGILRVDHPDILEFIDCKRDGSVTNFNISVAITDEFMRALEADDEYDLVDPHTKKVARRLRARDVMDRIIAAAWATGDPGLVFLDRANRSPANPVPDIELLEATNPCFTGDTLVWTSTGAQRFDQLANSGQPIRVLTQTTTGRLVWRQMSAIRKTRDGAPVFRVILQSQLRIQEAGTDATSAFRATGDHKVWLANGSTKSVSELLPGDRLASAYQLSSGELVHTTGAGSIVTSSAAPVLVNHEVLRVEYAGAEDVYCGSVEETHRFFIVTEHDNFDPHGGVLVANCGEQYLGPYDACNLGSLNLGLFVARDASGNAVDVDWPALEEATRLTTRFLDDVIDINPYPLPEVREKVHANRRIGLGVMGWAELLFELELRYDSAEATQLGERVMTAIQDWSRDESERLAEVRGPFPNWERSIYRDDKPLRNATRTTVAPTGSISILAECSSGIEPIFALAFQHRVKQPDGTYRVLDFVNPFFERALMASDIADKDAVLAYAKAHGSLHGHPAEQHPALAPYVTAHEIAPDWHIRMQAAFQKGVNNSISKCLAAGMLIPTSRGLVAIEDFSTVEEPDTFTDIAEDGITVGEHRVLSHYYAGEKPATRIRLDNGAELIGATESHRVQTSDGWKLMSELHVGDLVIGRFIASHGPGGAALPAAGEYRTNAKLVTIPDRMTPELALFLGMMAADGHTTLTTGAVGLTTADDLVASEFAGLAQQLFGMKPRHTVEKRNEHVQYLTLNSRVLCRWIRELIGEGAYNKRVPLQILTGSAEEKLAFLRGISLDGYYRPHHGLYIYAGMSEQLAYGVAEVCRSFGLPLVRRESVNVAYSGNTAHKVVVSNELQALVTCTEPHKNGEPHFATYQVLIDREVAGKTRLPTDHPFYSAFNSIRQRQAWNCDNRTAERIGWSADIPVHRVKAVEDAGVVSLYDIEVEDAHEYVVNGIVSHNTINLASSATYDDVRSAYMLAWELGCLGITIFRDGSKGEQVLNLGVKDAAKDAAKDAPASAVVASDVASGGAAMNETPADEHVGEEESDEGIDAQPSVTAPTRYQGGVKERPEVVSGYTRQVRAPEGKVNVTLNSDTDGLLEIFVNVGKAGSDIAALAEALGRLMSLTLQLDSSLSQNDRAREIARQLRAIGGSSSIGFGPGRVRSLPDAVARAIEGHFEQGLESAQPFAGSRASQEHTNGGNGAKDANGNGSGHNPAINPLNMEHFTVTGNLCPSCGNNTMYNEEGCRKCVSCGHSEC